MQEREVMTYLGLSPSDFERNPLLRYPASQEGLMEWERTQAELSWSIRPSSSPGIFRRLLTIIIYKDLGESLIALPTVSMCTISSTRSNRW